MTQELGAISQFPKTEDKSPVPGFLRTVVHPAVYARRIPLTVAAHHLHGEPIPTEEALLRPFSSFEIGQAWGGMWDTTWFRFRGTVPETWGGSEVVALIHLGGDQMVGFTAEGQIWDRHGRIVHGLHHDHRELRIAEQSTANEQIEFYVEAAANPIPPWTLGGEWPLLMPDYNGTPLYRLDVADLATVDRQVQGLELDMTILLELAEVSPDQSSEILRFVEGAVERIDPDDVAGSAAEARASLAPILGSASTSRNTVVAVGHAHIDTAWLWPTRETVRKCARTFSNQLTLLKRYPEHHFVCSQAAQYQWMKDEYPELFERIKDEVARGSWEPVGGMWVEPDTNVPSGESLVRQLILGKRFFCEEFGIETHELWIPDVFGYSAALPQIAQQAGVTALITQKMSWNDTNPFPHTTFWWEGHDGSQLLAHFPPADTYSGDFSLSELAAGQDRGVGTDGAALNLYLYGYGDGGGGPTAAMLERYRRTADLDGLPKITHSTVGEFFDRLRDEGRDLPVWVGELYLEAHRATLTTHADVKLANRRGEEALRAAEMWSVAASLDRRQALEQAWKVLLVQQFHDILPGSSIHWVYEDTRAHHAEVLEITSSIISESLEAVAHPESNDTSNDGLVAFNGASSDRTEVTELPDGSLTLVSVPACGWSQVRLPHKASLAPVEVGEGWIDNGLLRVSWDSNGLLHSIWDRDEDREVIADGQQANLFQLHEDNPRFFDAWDVDRSYLDHVTNLLAIDAIETVENDPLRAGIRFKRRFGQSTITQTMRLAAGTRRLEFHTEIDWHERHRFLKVAFPVAIRSTCATYEIQHGHIERPTVANTSWDTARFEVCGHRWADLSEPGYGVALLNDCKYGYDIAGNVMRLSLLRSPGWPDPEADQGNHRFAYALLPHSGDLRTSDGVIAQAEWFNLPIMFARGSRRGERRDDRPTWGERRGCQMGGLSQRHRRTNMRGLGIQRIRPRDAPPPFSLGESHRFAGTDSRTAQ